MNDREEIRRDLEASGITDVTEDEIDLIIDLASKGFFEPTDN